jgi:hypothetical protein
MRTATLTATSASTAAAAPSVAHAKRALLARHHIVAPSLKVADAAAAAVFGAARQRGPIARDAIARSPGCASPR